MVVGAEVCFGLHLQHLGAYQPTIKENATSLGLISGGEMGLGEHHPMRSPTFTISIRILENFWWNSIAIWIPIPFHLIDILELEFFKSYRRILNEFQRHLISLVRWPICKSKLHLQFRATIHSHRRCSRFQRARQLRTLKKQALKEIQIYSIRATNNP